MMNRVLIALASLGMVASQAGRVGASQIIDQQNLIGTTDFSASRNTPSFGQSFTPRLDAISFISTPLFSSASAASYRVNLYSGVGFGGTLLGQSAASDVPVRIQDDVDFVQFNFASLITLTPGSAYSFRLVRVSGSNQFLSGYFNERNPYSGGSFLGSIAGDVVSGTDLVFSEGYDTALVPAAVPEPSTLAGAGLGIAFAVGAALKRRGKADSACA